MLVKITTEHIINQKQTDKLTKKRVRKAHLPYISLGYRANNLINLHQSKTKIH